jgi:hypothetical protein
MSILNSFVKSRYYNKSFHNIGDTSFSRLFPSSEDFYSPENPTFGFFFQTETHLKQFKDILLRDGSLGIADFFLRFPFWVQGFPTVLLPYDLGFLVPESWQPHTKLYELVDDREISSNNKIDTVVFYSILNEAFTSWPLLKKNIHLFLKQNFKSSLNVNMFSLTKESIFQKHWNEDLSGVELVSEIQYFFNKKISFINKKELKQKINSNNSLFVNLDLYQNAIGLCSLEINLLKTKGNLLKRNKINVDMKYFIKNVKIHLGASLNIFNYVSEYNDFEYLNANKGFTDSKSEVSTGLVFKILEKRLSIC